MKLPKVLIKKRLEQGMWRLAGRVNKIKKFAITQKPKVQVFKQRAGDYLNRPVIPMKRRTLLGITGAYIAGVSVGKGYERAATKTNEYGRKINKRGRKKQDRELKQWKKARAERRAIVNKHGYAKVWRAENKRRKRR